MKKILEYLIYIYIILVTFSGIFVKLVSASENLLIIKSILPDCVILVIMIISMIIILKEGFRIKGKYFTRGLFSYVSIIFLINLIFLENMRNFLFVLRDIYFPFVLLTLLNEINIDEYNKKKIYKNICIILSFQVVLGFILGISQRILGWEWTSQFYAGHQFYGIDIYTGIKIWSTNGMLRVPSLAGDSTLFAYYNILSYFFIRGSAIKRKKILLYLCSGNIILSTNKTVLILLIIDIFRLIIRSSKKRIKFIIMGVSTIAFMIILVIIPRFIEGFYSTLFIRWINWIELIKDFNFFKPFGNLFSIGAGTEGFLSTFDNSYLYMLISYGIFGLIGYCLLLYSIYKSNKLSKNRLVLELLLVVIIGGITTNLFQGRVFFTPFCLLLFLIDRDIDSEHKNNRII
ncbi:hypothetical protein [Clostridium sartagoforme]|uniref:hypothetical protein n=1 Tax=Clostridium sartagoforme TaxID=84031 RepID=UPI0031E2B462